MRKRRKTRRTRIIFKRLKHFNFKKLACILYAVFTVSFTIFIVNCDIDIGVQNDNSIATNESIDEEINIDSAATQDTTKLANISILPLNSNISYAPLKKTLNLNNQNLSKTEEINVDDNSEVITKILEINEETSSIEETTIVEIETETITDNNEHSTELDVNSDCSLEEYINYLISCYSSYNTRIDLNYDNIFLLSRLSIAEAEGQSLEGKIGVCEVAINRSVTRNQTLSQVIYAKNAYGTPQFSCTTDGRIDLTPTKQDALAAIKAILGEQPTNGSIYFDNPDKAPNSWASRNRKKSVKIDSHQFYYNLPKDE